MSNKRSERRIRNNRIRRKKELRRNFFLTICLIITLAFTITGFRSNAKDDNSQSSYKYYKSITISNTDTLWSIAQEYMDTAHYDSINDYIREVQRMNNLSGDGINYGEHLIIPYYSEEYVSQESRLP